jgi:tubulin epsilon
MRFEGSHNVDLNEITTTLVPFPKLNILQSSLAPLFSLPDVAASASSSRRLDAMFSEAFTKGHQLMRGDPKRAVHLACGLLARGDISLSDMTRNVDRLKSELRMARWNPDGFKVGICGAKPLHQPCSLLTLSNNTSIVPTLSFAYDRFMHLYRVRAHSHHYTDFMDPRHFQDALGTLTDTISAYNELEADED